LILDVEKEAIVYVKVLSQQLPGGTEGNLENSYSL
jgi:hypothetical protein